MRYIKAGQNVQATFSIAVIVSQFNHDITSALKEGALQRLTNASLENDIVVVEVPGAIEIPIVAKRLAQRNQFDAIIALGAVIRGETTHYDYVCQQVSDGCMHVSLTYDTPIIFGVLTTENEQQAWDRLGGKHGHKGVEAADCALAMADILKQL